MSCVELCCVVLCLSAAASELVGDEPSRQRQASERAYTKMLCRAAATSAGRVDPRQRCDNLHQFGGCAGDCRPAGRRGSFTGQLVGAIEFRFQNSGAPSNLIAPRMEAIHLVGSALGCVLAASRLAKRSLSLPSRAGCEASALDDATHERSRVALKLSTAGGRESNKISAADATLRTICHIPTARRKRTSWPTGWQAHRAANVACICLANGLFDRLVSPARFRRQI